MDLWLFKQQFDIIFNAYFRKKITEAKDLVENENIANILEHTYTLASAGGKRIRPYCFSMGYHIYQKETNNDIDQLSILFEVFHTMALIHDDIIDESPKRHNIPTIHHLLQEQNMIKRVAESQALLIGDLLLSRVYEILTKQYTFPQTNKQAANQTIHSMIQETILGQMMDVNLSLGEKTSREILEKRNLYKTARYTFARPLVAGAQIAGASTEQIQILQKVGESLGLAYQLRDDMIDIVETERDKTTFADIQEGQQTIFTYYIQEYGNQEQQDLLKECMGKPLTQTHRRLLKKMFASSWAIDFVKQKIAVHVQDATAELQNIHFVNKEERANIEQLMQRLTRV